MRKFLLVLMAGLGLVLGCTSVTPDGGGDGEGDGVDTQAVYPNDRDNYWTYAVDIEGDDHYEDWTIIDDPGYQLCYSQQRIRVHSEGAPDNTYMDLYCTDDETEAVINEGFKFYDEGDQQGQFMFEDHPWTMLRWQSDGLDVGDTWHAWLISGVPPGLFYHEPFPADSLDLDLTANVESTGDFYYKGHVLTAYKIVFFGEVIFELDGVDPEDWEHHEFQMDYYFVPEFGWVKIQWYTNEGGSQDPWQLWTLTDTNVAIPN
ncbi:MAG: hypothetical protein NTW26_11780 [bacterium]|nr:hypothetical protein [bacterium]